MPPLAELQRGRCFAFSPDGKRVVAATSEGDLIVWDLADESPLGLFAKLLGHSLIVETVRFPSNGRINSLRWNGRWLAAASDNGLCLLEVQNRATGPPLVTAWLRELRKPWWSLRCKKLVGVACPLCREWGDVPDSVLGTETRCPNCGGLLRLNTFAIEADWRTVATSWTGQE